MNIEEGKSIQDGTPTPDNPVEIVNIFEVNGIQYQDNIPQNYFISITKEQFCEYEQLKERIKTLSKLGKVKDHNIIEQREEIVSLITERDKYKSIVDGLKEWLEDENNQQYSKYIYNYSINNWVLNKIKELEEGNSND